MVDDAHPPASDSDPVIPPPPAAAPGQLGSSVPLAPPLGGIPGPPAPLLPYASASQPGQHPQMAAYPPPHPGQPSPPYGAAYPSPSAPPPPRSGRTVGIVIAAVAAFVLIVVVGIAVAVSLLLSSRTEPATAPPATSVTEEPAAPSEAPQGDPDSDGSGDADASAIADALQAKIDEYKRLRDSGALWQSIPDTEFNRTAVSAFLYFLTDMKVATIWGVDDAQAQEYEERMTMLEERLLAEQPLGDDIQITLEDEVFTYDGETGEGGYTPR